MRVRTLFIILALLVGAMIAYVLTLDFGRNMLPFYILEGGAVALVLYLIYFYRRVVMPLDILAGGMDLLKAQDWNNLLVHVGQRETDAVVDVFNQMLIKLRDQRQRYEEQSYLLQQLIETTASGIVITAPGGVVVMANPSSAGLVGSSLDAGTKIDSISTPVAAAMTSMTPGDEQTVYGSDSTVTRIVCRQFINCGASHRFFVIDNITDTVIKAEKGGYQKVIRMISHEVNNSVGAMASALDTVASLHEDEEGADSEIASLLRSCVGRATNLSSFVSRYAAVVKLPAPQPVAVRSEAMLDRMMPFLESVAGKGGVVLRFDLSVPLPDVMADVPLLEQALVNIVKNAVESIGPDRPLGLVTLSARDDRGRLAITVTDNGSGISPEKASHIFTPFFTDKPGGHGLGLMAVRDILRGHGAEFSLSTDPSDGLTRFRIRFPHL